jgi:hypothetical protein
VVQEGSENVRLCDQEQVAVIIATTGSESLAIDQGNDSGYATATIRAVFVLLCYQGYAYAVLGVGAPFIATGFGLSQSGIAQMYAWISLNSIGALILSRMADRVGRRRIILISLVITPSARWGLHYRRGRRGSSCSRFSHTPPSARPLAVRL